MLENAEHIVISEGIARVLDKDKKVILAVSSDMLAQEYFTKSRPIINGLEPSLRWMSPSHSAFIHERPPRMLRIYISNKLYYLPVPWTILCTVINSLTGKVEISQMLFANSQLSYDEQEIFYPEIPINDHEHGRTYYGGGYVDLHDQESGPAGIISSSVILRDGMTASSNRVFESNFSPEMLERFRSEDNKFDYDKYFEQLSELSLKDNLYIPRKRASTLGELIERISSKDEEVNTHFYEDKPTFEYLLDLIAMIHDRQEAFLEEVEPDYEGEHEEEPDFDEAEPIGF